TKRGTLTIAGSGIASVAHITLETLSYIRESDKIFYLVCDPVTEAYIQDNSTADCLDLSVFYDKNKGRYDSYIQMCEVMLKAVRAGHDVLGVFYGHPGVFVSPSHRAIAVARQEGYKARMLPGISAEDYMFADLEFDPCRYGCKTCEATEILLRDKPFDPSIQNIIWQVGSVGVVDMEFEKSKFQLLVDRLEKDFGPAHKVVHYIGAVLPQSTTTMDTFTIADLRKEDVAKQFGTIWTLYIPPRDEGHIDVSMAEAFEAPCLRCNEEIYDRFSTEAKVPGGVQARSCSSCRIYGRALRFGALTEEEIAKANGVIALGLRFVVAIILEFVTLS
ncbi:tetrapyrrole methylase, partial [Rhizopogon vinicolor AM-OR11-026]